MKTKLLLLLAIFSLTIAKSQITINFHPGENISDTVSLYLSEYPSEQIFFNFTPGTYSVSTINVGEQSQAKSITLKTVFQSTTGNMGDVIIESTAYEIFKVTKSSVYIRNLTIRSIDDGGSYKNVISIINEMNPIDSVIIENCHIIAGLEDNDNGFAYSSGEVNNVSNIFIKNNIIENGDVGVNFNFDEQSFNIVINNNNFINQKLTNIKIENTANLKITNNIIELPNNLHPSNNVIGIELNSTSSSTQYTDSSTIISNNKLTKIYTTGTAYTAIKIFNTNVATSSKFNIINNIIDINTDTTITGLYLSSTDGVNFLHNSIRLIGDSTVGVALEQGSINFKNNLVETTKYAFVGLSSYTIDGMDYNNYYSNITNQFYDGYYSLTSYSLDTWVTESNAEHNSTDINPNFTTIIGELVTTNEQLNNTVYKLPEVNYDYNGLLRQTPMCDVGAKEVAFVNLGNDTMLCYGESIILDAGLANSYIWNTGDTTQTITTNTSGVYSVTITEFTGGATAIDTINVEILPQFSISFNSDEPNCYNSSEGYIVANTTNGLPPFNYNWAGSFDGDGTDSLYNLGIGTYYLTITDANLCTTENYSFINAPTQLSVSFDTVEFCGGCFGELTANAAGGTGSYNYLWSTGNTNSHITDLCTGMYILTLTDNNNCTFIDSTNITESLLGYLSGTIDYSGGLFDANDVKVELYKEYVENAFYVEKIDENMIDGTSKFQFTNVYPNQYTFRGILEQGNYQNIATSYYGNTVDWYNATYITIGCGDTINNIEFSMYEVENLTGTGTFSGNITYQSSNKSTNLTGEPVTGAEIYIAQDPNTEPIANAVSDNNGYWEVDSIQEGTGYKLRVDIPGLEQISTYENLYITPNDTVQSNLNFIVDTTSGGGITTDTTFSSIKTSNQTIKIKVYPNPSTDFVSFETSLNNVANIKFEIVNINGETLYTSNELNNYIGDFKVKIDISDYSIGTYIIKFKIDNNYYLKKIIKQ